MKKIYLLFTIIFLIIATIFVVARPSQASSINSNSKVIATKKTTIVKKPVVSKKIVAKVVSKPAVKLKSVAWSASGLKSVTRIPSGIRPAYKKKVENYARRNHIKSITANVVNSMRE